MLAAVGCEVSVAQNGAEGLALARVIPRDIIFLDLLMPGMDGAATARAILSDPDCGHPVIAAHSAADVAHIYEQARAAGCVEFIAKPIQAEQLYQCLQTHLRVEFDYEALPPSLEILPPWRAGQISLPQELHRRITTAAELHSTTALKICLQDLRQINPDGQILAEHIRHLMRSYDMDGIVRLICQTTTGSTAYHGLAAS
jgi:CheY-like chemotaxis protein